MENPQVVSWGITNTLMTLNKFNEDLTEYQELNLFVRYNELKDHHGYVHRKYKPNSEGTSFTFKPITTDEELEKAIEDLQLICRTIIALKSTPETKRNIYKGFLKALGKGVDPCTAQKLTTKEEY